MRKRENPCGTATGYRRHYRAGEKPCEPCRTAQQISRNRCEATVPSFIEFDYELWICHACHYREICPNIEDAQERARRHQCPSGI